MQGSLPNSVFTVNPVTVNPVFLHPGQYDAVIVDLDGTMVDTMGDFVVALNCMLADIAPAGSAAATLDAATVSRMVGKGSEHLVSSVLAHVQALPEAALPALAAEPVTAASLLPKLTSSYVVTK